MSFKYSQDMDLIGLARDIVKYEPEKDKKAEADALFWYVKKVRFVNDPLSTELVQSPFFTLREQAGDCDDLSVCLVCLGTAIGIASRFVIAFLPVQRFS